MNSEQQQAPRAGGAKALLFSMLACLIFFVAIEGLLRAYVGWKVWHESGRALPPPAQRNAYQRLDPEIGYSLTPGYDAGGIHVNALGLRGPEIAASKPAGIVRIVAIGDSTTFGLAGEQCPYPARLQALLDEWQPGRFEVLNAGVEGYSLAYARKFFEHRIRPLFPDIVTVYIGWNDIYSLDPFRPSETPFHERVRADTGKAGGWGQAVARMLDHLYLAQLIRRLLYVEFPRLVASSKGEEGRGASLVHPAMANGFAHNLGQFVAEIRASRATPVLMTLPSVLSENMSEKARGLIHYPTWARGDSRLFRKVVEMVNETIREVARREKVLLIDNAGFVNARGIPKDELFFDTLHMYCEGYDLLARNIAQALRREAIVN